MNVSILLMSSALVAGGDPGCDGCAPTPVVSYSSGCGCDPCGGGPFSKLKSLFGGKPLFFGFGGFKNDCDPCGTSKPGLLARLKDKLGCHKDEPCPCATPCDPCGGSGAPVTGCALPAVPGVPSDTSYYGTPQAMPQSGYQPQLTPTTTYAQPQAMPSSQAMPSTAPAAEAMPKPAEVKPTPDGGVQSPTPSIGIPAVQVPRI